MKKIIYSIFFFSYFTLKAQVGIGTTLPNNTSILDVSSTKKGILIPRMLQSERNSIGSAEKSLLIFNKTNNNFEYNSGIASGIAWTSIHSDANQPSVKFSTSANTDNINTLTPEKVNVFNTLNWNDDISTFSKVSNSELTITQPGRYEITSNVAVIGINSTGSTEQRTGVELFLAVNDIQAGVNAATAYIRYAGNPSVRHNTASLHISETIEIDNTSLPSTISIQSIRRAQSGIVRVSMSNIYIKKVR